VVFLSIMIIREAANTLVEMANGFYVVAVTGPRQSGKTTLVREVFSEKSYVSLEDPDEREFASQDPRRFLSRFSEGAIIDEVQRCPDLFAYLQTKVDQDRQPGQFILTGSQQFGLLSKITQSLSGRVGLLELLPFSLSELQSARHEPNTVDELLLRGLYPAVYDRTLEPGMWFRGYMQTYVERDVRQIINIRELSTFQRFLRMCAARVGQLLNLSNLANECGITHNTAKSWISLLEASYIVFLLRPHHKNFNKRLVKTPKLYFFDTGFATWLLGIREVDQLSIHAHRGALFENWVLTELVKARYNQGHEPNLYFWRNHIGDEVDVILERGAKLVPVEIKSGETLHRNSYRGLTKWLSLAGEEAANPSLCYGGNKRYNREGIEVYPWRLINHLWGFEVE